MNSVCYMLSAITICRCLRRLGSKLRQINLRSILDIFDVCICDGIWWRIDAFGSIGRKQIDVSVIALVTNDDALNYDARPRRRVRGN